MLTSGASAGLALDWRAARRSQQLAGKAQAVRGREAKLIRQPGVGTRRAEMLERQIPRRRGRDGERQAAERTSCNHVIVIQW